MVIFPCKDCGEKPEVETRKKFVLRHTPREYMLRCSCGNGAKACSNNFSKYVAIERWNDQHGATPHFNINPDNPNQQ